MTENVIAYLKEQLKEATWEEGTAWPTVALQPLLFKEQMQLLRSDENLQFDYLFNETCIDWKTHLTMVYHLRSMQYKHQLVIKLAVDRNQPEVPTLSDIWKSANFLEREVYEMFGVNFIGHPDLRLLILPDGWEGKNPLRKDFEDPINMIRL